MKCSLTFVVLLSQWLFIFSHADQILMLAPVCSKSHKISFMPIIEALAEKGHQVTVVTPFPPDNTIKNVREVVIENNIFTEMEINWFQMSQEGFFDFFARTIKMFRMTMTIGYQQFVRNEEIQEIIQSRDVDLVIVDAILNDFVLQIVDHLNVPYIFYSSAASVPWVMNAISAPLEYATVPDGLGDSGSEMTFMERLSNMLSSELFLLVRKIFWLHVLDEIAIHDFPNTRTIAEIERDSQLCILNSHPATAWTRPLPQNVIPIPALHTRPTKPLPQV